VSDAYDDDHKRELRRLADALRGLVESAVALTAPLPALAAMADEAEALGARAAGFAGQRPFPRYSAPVNGDLNTILPWGVISGPYNPLAAPVSMSMEEGKAIGTARFGLAYEGPPGGVHGGVVAAVWDQVLAYACMIRGTPGHTATFTTHFRAITPLHQELRFEAWVERSDGRRIFAHGRCHAGETLVSEAEGMFIRFRDGAIRPDAT
jgi:acyl-coenzyme A thioesterase PaaI-like protein